MLDSQMKIKFPYRFFQSMQKFSCSKLMWMMPFAWFDVASLGRWGDTGYFSFIKPGAFPGAIDI
jgi:hypothetical protein